MILSPPIDGAIITVYFLSAIGGALAFVVIVLLEAGIFYLLGWAGKLGSLLLSFLANLLSTALGWIPAALGLVSLDAMQESIVPWVVLFVLSMLIEAFVYIFQVKRVGEVLVGSAIANIASYLVLISFYMLIL